MSESMNGLLEAALGYRQRGWSVIPLVHPGMSRSAASNARSFFRNALVRRETFAWNSSSVATAQIVSRRLWPLRMNSMRTGSTET